MIKNFIKKFHYNALLLVIGETPVITNVDGNGTRLTVKSQTKGIYPYNAMISDGAFMGEVSEKIELSSDSFQKGEQLSLHFLKGSQNMPLKINSMATKEKTDIIVVI